MRSTIDLELLSKPPWHTLQLWHTANTSLAHIMRRHQSRLELAKQIASQIRRQIESLDDLMGTLCSQTCPDCLDVCCHHATVWYDFRDLLYMHLSHVRPPANQLHTAPDRPCPCFGHCGCTLPRTQRPFICTWYLCATQKARLSQMVASRELFLRNILGALKQARCKLEDLFLQSTA